MGLTFLKINLYLFLFVVLAVTAVTANDTSLHLTLNAWGHYTSRYFVFPGDDGKMHLVDSEEPINRTLINKYRRDLDCNQYWLYTRSNPKSKQVLKFKNNKSVKRSYFNPKKITVFAVHGWKGEGNTEMNVLLTKVFLKQGDVNVIVLDWSKLANTNYVTAKTAVPTVGRMLGNFVSWLKTFGMSLKKVHLVGHSLGGHLVGNAGKALKGKAGRITALDPAGPLWYYDKDNRVTSTDARYVEVIHTNDYMAGYPYPSGHSDHYPNGGSFMPGCMIMDLSCHHARSWKYMAASVELNNFNANTCSKSWHVILNKCAGPLGKMGNSDITKRQYGIYRVNTKEKYPYVKPGNWKMRPLQPVTPCP